jgi:hypothetical protein
MRATTITDEEKCRSIHINSRKIHQRQTSTWSSTTLDTPVEGARWRDLYCIITKPPGIWLPDKIPRLPVGNRNSQPPPVNELMGRKNSVHLNLVWSKTDWLVRPKPYVFPLYYKPMPQLICLNHSLRSTPSLIFKIKYFLVWNLNFVWESRPVFDRLSPVTVVTGNLSPLRDFFQTGIQNLGLSY